jgi:glycerol kinase
MPKPPTAAGPPLIDLLLDCGGQSCRALAVDNEGAVLCNAEQPVATREADGRVEQDGDALVAAFETAIGEVVAGLEQRGRHIRHAALAVQRGNVICWDRNTLKPLSPALSWRDRRSLARLQPIGKKADEIKQRTGLRFSPYGGASKLAWCLDNIEPVAKAAREQGLAMGPLGSFLVARLVDEHPAKVDDTLAQRTLLWSRQGFDWDEGLLELFGLSMATLPTVYPSHHCYGHLDAVPGRPPLSLLMGDQNAIPWLSGEPDPDCLYINLGTGAFLLRPLTRPIHTPLFQLSLLDRRAAVPRFALEASVHGAASALAWLAGKTGDEIGPDRLEGLPGRVSRPILFVNSIDGLGSPWWRPGPEAGFVGEIAAGESGLDQQVLAVLESIAFLVRANVDAMASLAGPPRRVVVSGGLSQSETLCSLLATMLGCDIERLRSAEGTAMGLWCALNGRGLGPELFDRIQATENPSLTARYQPWLEAMLG